MGTPVIKFHLRKLMKPVDPIPRYEQLKMKTGKSLRYIIQNDGLEIYRLLVAVEANSKRRWWEISG